MTHRRRRKMWEIDGGNSESRAERAQKAFQTNVVRRFGDQGQDCKGRIPGVFPDGSGLSPDGSEFLLPARSELVRWGPPCLVNTRDFDDLTLAEAIQFAVWAAHRLDARQELLNPERIHRIERISKQLRELQEDLFREPTDALWEDMDFVVLLASIETAQLLQLSIRTTGRFTPPSDTAYFAQQRLSKHAFPGLSSQNLLASMLFEWGLTDSEIAALSLALGLSSVSFDSLKQSIQKARHRPEWWELGCELVDTTSMHGRPGPADVMAVTDAIDLKARLRGVLFRALQTHTQSTEPRPPDLFEVEPWASAAADSELLLYFHMVASIFRTKKGRELALSDLSSTTSSELSDLDFLGPTGLTVCHWPVCHLVALRLDQAYCGKDQALPEGLPLLLDVGRRWGDDVACRVSLAVLSMLDLRQESKELAEAWFKAAWYSDDG